MLFKPAALLALTVAAAAAAPAGRPAAAGEGPVLIEGVPHVRQKPDFCGEACAEMWLAKLGRKITQDQVFNLSGVDPAAGRGCYTRELNAALRKIGFRTGDVATPIDPEKEAEDIGAAWGALLADLRAGVPSIVCMRTSDRPEATEHFRLVLGCDPKTDEVIYHEPAQDKADYRRMKRAEFLKLWPLKYSAAGSRKMWTAIRLRLEPGELIGDPPAAAGFTAADFAQHVMRLRKKLPGKDFTVAVQPPFVVTGDEAPDVVGRRATDTVKWVVDRLRKDYFQKDPAQIITVWLFRDKASYEKNAEALFGAKPTTPYGYYSSTHEALVMNIATGGGTLAHEIVHPFVRADFPDCPSWLNEGLGSLYEQCGDKGGRIWGFPNWRLPALQKAIRAGTVPSFKDLTATSSDEFYNKDKGTNYAQARYLCYYLQEKDKLAEFYREFRAGCKADPTGYETLKKVLGEEDMDAFTKRWEEFVTALSYP